MGYNFTNLTSNQDVMANCLVDYPSWNKHSRDAICKCHLSRAALVFLQVCSITHLTSTQGLESTFTPQDGFGIPIPIEKLLKLWFEHTAFHEIDIFFSRHQEDTEWVICRRTGLSYYFKTISASSVITTR